VRVPLGFTSGLVVLWLADPSVASLAGGGVVACIGEALRVWAAGHLQKSREVTASGPYRWMAHPLYVGSAIMGAGLAIASARLSVAAIIAIYLVVTLAAAVRTEERSLRRVFGDAYDRYRRAGEVDAARRFSFAQAVANGEHRAIAGVAVAFGLLALKAAG
jgi:protein-S-isoprenylcysteine O-methyltransferase Ste14